MCFLVVQISKEIEEHKSFLAARAAINMNRGALRSLRLKLHHGGLADVHKCTVMIPKFRSVAWTQPYSAPRQDICRGLQFPP